MEEEPNPVQSSHFAWRGQISPIPSKEKKILKEKRKER